MTTFLSKVRRLLQSPLVRSGIDAELLEDRILLSAVPLIDAAMPSNDPGIASFAFASSDQIAPDLAIPFDSNAVQSAASPLNSTDNRLASPSRSLELVFINSNTPHYQQLVDDLLSHADTSRDFEIYLLDATKDGIQQISEILAGYSSVDAINIISHGENGAIQLGNVWLNNAALPGYAGDFASWQSSLSSNADLLFYGCDLAKSADGRELVESLSALTGADVAASTDATGHSDFGGNWKLEYFVGTIETDPVFSKDLQALWHHKLATISVNTFSDVINSSDGVFSLREAIIQANAGSGGETIVLSAGTYTLSIAGAGEDNAASGDLDLRKSVTITGAGVSTIINANNLDRAFHVKLGTANLSQLVIRNGNAGGLNGGGLLVDSGATASLSCVVVSGNTAFDGGGIDNAGTLNLLKVLIENNQATHHGGGIGSTGTVTLGNVTVSNNTAQANNGGGIDIRSGSLTASNVTISGNASQNEGGGIYVAGSLSLQNVTISDNNASNKGSGIRQLSGSVSLRDTIVAGNSGASDLDGIFTSLGHNIIGNVGSATGLVNGTNNDQVGSSGTPIDAKLGALGYNGGFTPTHALKSGSTALNAGSTTSILALDQREFARSGAPDIGSYESTPTILSNQSEFHVNGSTIGNQETNASARGSHQAVAMAADGSYIVVWSDDTTDGNGWGVFARRFNADGTGKGAEFRVNATNIGDEHWAVVASDGSGRFVIAWTAQDSSNTGIYLRRFNADGSAIDAADILVNSQATANDQLNPSITMNNAGQIVIAWQTNSGSAGVFAKQFNMASTATANQVPTPIITVDAGSNRSNAVVDINEDGRFVVTWNNDTTPLAQRYAADGSARGGQIAVSPVPSPQAQQAVVAVQDSGDFVVAYRSNISFFEGIWFRRFKDDGTAYSTSAKVSSGASHTAPSISMDSSGNFMVVYEGDGDGSSQGVFGRAYNAAGASQSAQFQINQSTTNAQHEVSVAMIGLNNFVAVWSGNGDQPGQTDSSGVFARQFGSAISDVTDSDTATNSVAEGSAVGTTVGITANAIDPSAGDTVSYSLNDDAGGRFGIDAITGVVTVANSFLIDFETATSHTISVLASSTDGTTSTKVFTIAVTAVNESNPVITSNGGGNTATISIAENTTSVTTVTATDADLPAPALTFSIIGGADSARFLINASSGVLTFSIAPNFEAPTDASGNNVYDILVQVSDGLLTSTQSLAVSVTNVNEFSASSISDTNSATNSVAEGAAIGTTVGITANATDSDTGDSISYSLTNNAGGRFTIHATTGVVTVASSSLLDYETATSHSITVKALSSDGSFTTQVFTIAVSPVNESAPIITSNSGGNAATISIAENTTAVTTVTATDADLPTSTLSYSISGGADSAKFSINPTTGTLAFLSAPNSETPTDSGSNNVYDVIVRVSDGLFIDTQSIAVTVTNVNEFSTGAISDTNGAANSVSEGAAIGTAVGITANATDLDAGSAITYSLTNSAGGRFTIHATTGVVTVANSGLLDFETATSHSISVQATSSDGSFSTRAFTIGLSPVNESAPVITNNGGGSSASLNIAENTTAVTTITATDADLPAATLSYSIVGGADFSKFSINPTTGALAFLTAPNFETPTDAGGNNTYDLVVQVSDGQLTDTQSIAVTVTNVNNPPTGVADSYTVVENGALTTQASWLNNAWSTRKQITFNNATGPALTDQVVLVTLNASNIDYSLTQNGGQDLRFVDTDGTILNYEIEQWNEAGTSTVWVRVPQIDAASTSDSISMYYGNSTAMAGQNPTGVWTSNAQAILHLNGTPIDSSVQANVVTDSSTSSTSGFISNARSFNGATSEISLGSAASVDNLFNGGGTLSTWIKPTGWGENGYGRIADKASVIFNGSTSGDGWVLQVNGNTGALIFEQGFSGHEGEWRTAAGTISLNVWQQVTVVYDSASASNVPKIFINGIEVAVTQNAAPSGMAKSDAANNLMIGNYSQAATRTFDGAIDEFRIYNSSLTTAQIQADYKAIVGTLTTMGAAQVGPGGVLTNDLNNEGNALTAGLATGPSNALSFSLNSDGSFTYIPLANFSGSDSFTYLLSDGFTTSAPILVSLAVTSANDLPIITSHSGASSVSLTRSENVALVTTVTATDTDIPTQNLTYSLSGGSDQGRFSINSVTGALSFSVGNVPDFELANDSNGDNIYDVVVTVSDGQGGLDTQSLSINITDVSEFSVSTIFDSNNALDQVDELAVNGSVVGITALATDADGTNNTITYSLSDDAGGRFEINSSTGIVTIANGTLIDRETAATHAITVRASSSDGSQSLQSFTINVIDSDEFDVGAITDQLVTADAVSENAVSGTTVGITVLAIDADATNNTITYSLTDDAGGRFAIDSSTGVVTVSDGSLINFELATSHMIMVLATSSDGSQSTQSFTINVLDVNEFAVGAITDQQTASNNIVENASNGSTVGITAQAVDEDASNNTVTYSLTDNAGGRFTIDATTGVVTVANGSLLNREAAASHMIVVRAASSDGSQSTQPFTINLDDVDEFDVSAISDGSTAANAVNENATNGTVVGITAFASDADATNNTITYSLTNSAGGRFTINASTGVVTVANSTLLNREVAASHSIVVRAASSDGSQSTKTFTITVKDVDEFDVGSITDQNSASNIIDENLANGTIVGITANATDADATNNTISYSLTNTAGGRFAINSSTGVVTVANGSLLNREISSSHSIAVRAISSDGSISNNIFTITVADVDEFDVSAITDSDATSNSISENAANGTFVGISATASDADATNNAITYSLLDNAGGRFAINASTGLVTVADGTLIDRELSSSHDILVLATSADASSTTTRFSINVSDVNDNVPIFTSGSVASTFENSVLVQQLSATDADLNAQSIAFIIVGGFDASSFSINSSNELVFLNAPNFESPSDVNLDNVYEVNVAAIDSSGSQTVQSIQVHIMNINEGTFAANQTHAIRQGESFVSTGQGLLIGASDEDGDPLTVGLITGPSNGVLVLDADGTFTYVPNILTTGSDTFVFQVSDGHGGVSQGTVTFQIDPSNQLNIVLPNPTPSPNRNSSDSGNNASNSDSRKSSDTTSNSDSSSSTDSAADSKESSTQNTIFVTPAADSSQGDASNAVSDRNKIAIHDTARNENSHASNSLARSTASPTSGDSHSIQRVIRGLTSLSNVRIAEQLASTVLGTIDFASAQSVLFEDLDRLREQFRSNENAQPIVIGAAASVASGLSVGYVMWLLRGGYIVAGFMAQLPAWRLIDPLPILAQLEAMGDDDDDDSLETMVDRSNTHHDKNSNLMANENTTSHPILMNESESKVSLPS